MAQDYFQFKQFLVRQHMTAMKVCTDSCILGAFDADRLLREERPPGSILDIGGGTGLLSLMLAQKTAAHITAVEINADAAAQMRANFAASPWPNRLHALQADVRVWQPTLLFDHIVCNPPFFENDLKGNHHGRTMAMHDTGLLLSELISRIAQWLQPYGSFAVMVPFSRSAALSVLLQSTGLHTQTALRVSHSRRHAPFRMIIYGKKQAVHCETEDLFIKDGDEYSAAFRQLLRDYYLNL